MLVAVTGSREIVIDDRWEQILREYLEHAEVFVHGACPHPKRPKIRGAVSIDAWAEEIALGYSHIKIVRFPADWSLGAKGGPIRNAEMALWCSHQNPLEQVLLAFPGNRGTRSCMTEFRKVRIRVELVEELVRVREPRQSSTGRKPRRGPAGHAGTDTPGGASTSHAASASRGAAPVKGEARTTEEPLGLTDADGGTP